MTNCDGQDWGNDWWQGNGYENWNNDWWWNQGHQQQPAGGIHYFGKSIPMMMLTMGSTNTPVKELADVVQEKLGIVTDEAQPVQANCDADGWKCKVVHKCFGRKRHQKPFVIKSDQPCLFTKTLSSFTFELNNVNPPQN